MLCPASLNKVARYSHWCSVESGRECSLMSLTIWDLL